MRRWPAALAGIVLCGCAVSQTPADRLAADVAVCRRHAMEGPGGPSAQVGDRITVNGLNNRRTIAQIPIIRPSVNQREIVYRECLEVRGHSMPSNGLKPVDPDAVGSRTGRSNPV